MCRKALFLPLYMCGAGQSSKLWCPIQTIICLVLQYKKPHTAPGQHKRKNVKSSKLVMKNSEIVTVILQYSSGTCILVTLRSNKHFKMLFRHTVNSLQAVMGQKHSYLVCFAVSQDTVTVSCGQLLYLNVITVERIFWMIYTPHLRTVNL